MRSLLFWSVHWYSKILEGGTLQPFCNRTDPAGPFPGLSVTVVYRLTPWLLSKPIKFVVGQEGFGKLKYGITPSLKELGFSYRWPQKFLANPLAPGRARRARAIAYRPASDGPRNRVRAGDKCFLCIATLCDYEALRPEPDDKTSSAQVTCNSRD
jgi:hypothetical protein